MRDVCERCQLENEHHYIFLKERNTISDIKDIRWHILIRMYGGPPRQENLDIGIYDSSTSSR